MTPNPGPVGPNSIAPLVTAFTEGWWPVPMSGPLLGRVGTAARCLQLNAQQVATMPLRFRGNYEPAWVTNPDPAWFPNGIADAIFAAVWSMYAHGDAFLWVTSRYADSDYPATWTVLDASTMVVTVEDGQRHYSSNGHDLNTNDVRQVTRDPNGNLRGTGALNAYASNLSSAAAAESFAADTFAAGGVPNAVLKPQRRITSEQATELQAQWVQKVGTRMAAPAVIPPDVEFEQLAFSPKDLLLLESREYDARQIAAAFGVPPFLVNLPLTGGLTYQSPAMLTDLWWRTELMPAAHRIEAALSHWVPRGNWVEFDPSVILRPDLVSLSSTWLALLAAGVVTIDEVRAAVLDLPPLSEGEALAMIDEPAAGQASEGSAPVVPMPALEVVGNV
jgi:HK97 family phage portal protein